MKNKSSKLLKILIIIFFVFFIGISSKVYAITKIVLDPGHGGTDCGATNKAAGLYEADVNLAIAKYLKEYLNEYANIEVILTHDGTRKDTMELKERAMVARTNNADMLISLHINSSESSQITGAEVYVTNSTVLKKYNYESTLLAKEILNEISKLGIKDRGVKTRSCRDDGEKWHYSDGSNADYYGIIRYSMKGNTDSLGADIVKGEGTPAMIIEHCYIKNGDEQYINSSEKIKKIAKADCNAIVKYYNLKLKEKTVSSVYLDKNNIDLLIGEKQNLKATIYPETAENKNLKWVTSNDNILEVDQNGNIVGKEVGTATITVITEDQNKIATCTVNVKEINLSLKDRKIDIVTGKKLKAILTISPESAKNKNITWNSKNSNIAIVDEKGVIKGISEGTTEITAQVEDKTISIIVVVHKIDENNNLNDTELNCDEGIILDYGEKVTITDYKKKIKLSERYKIEGYNNQNNLSNENDYLSTGSTITIIDNETGEKIHQYYIIYHGDINGDGIVDSMDMFKLRQILMGETSIESIFLEAANISNDSEGKVDSMDMFKLRQYLMLK